MKMKTLSVLAGVAAPLIATTVANSAFVGFKVVQKLDPNTGLAPTFNGNPIFVCNVYAEFDNAGNDYMTAVAGTPNNPLEITVLGGGTFHNVFGGRDFAPTTMAVNMNPDLRYDSFYTIGLKSVGPAGDNLIRLYLDTLFGTMTASTTDGSWAVPGFPNGTTRQNDPFDANNSFPGNGQILIGQFSTSTGTGIRMAGLVQVSSDGNRLFQTPISFTHLIPTPGALGLLGAAGLIGRRRRRR